MNANVFKSYTKPTSNKNVLFWESNFWNYEVTKDELLLLIPYSGKVKNEDLELFPNLVVLEIKDDIDEPNENYPEIDSDTILEVFEQNVFKVILMTKENIKNIDKATARQIKMNVVEYSRLEQ